MAAFLSAEWLAVQQHLGADLPERPGASAVLQITVAGAPDGDVVYIQHFEDGRIVAAELGSAATADVALAQTYVDAVAIAQGELDLSVGFMRGRVKMVGPTGALMAILPVTRSELYRAMVLRLAAQTAH